MIFRYKRRLVQNKKGKKTKGIRCEKKKMEYLQNYRKKHSEINSCETYKEKEKLKEYKYAKFDHDEYFSSDQFQLPPAAIIIIFPCENPADLCTRLFLVTQAKHW